MGLFRKDRAPEPSELRLPSLTPAELARIGQAAYGAPPHAGAVPSLVDPIVVEAYSTIGFAKGTPTHTRLTEQLLDALERGGATSAPWGVVGAFLIAKNYLTDDGLAHPPPDGWAPLRSASYASRACLVRRCPRTWPRS